ncbi:hypothetical protein [Mesomycoplasma neurolyticum]|uniref:Lipoprotein n=1 Tax=Mesomycoplasma neurolyticum TaxID=2120 RepID=A0A449A4W2_9BACT|nr:hypothetical protein [Mesomycoplasma neurolyticum]VEU59254.1 Uncharacterised protein [Mesomycoplasma neurolyticum]
MTNYKKIKSLLMFSILGVISTTSFIACTEVKNSKENEENLSPKTQKEMENKENPNPKTQKEMENKENPNPKTQKEIENEENPNPKTQKEIKKYVHSTNLSDAESDEIEDEFQLKVTKDGEDKYLEILTIIQNQLTNGWTIYEIFNESLDYRHYPNQKWVEVKLNSDWRAKILSKKNWEVNFDNDNWIIEFKIPIKENDSKIYKKLLLKFKKPENIYKQSIIGSRKIQITLNDNMHVDYSKFKNDFYKKLFETGSAGDAITSMSEGENPWFKKEIKDTNYIDQTWEYNVVFNDETKVVRLETKLVNIHDEDDEEENTFYFKFDQKDKPTLMNLSKNLLNEKATNKNLDIKLSEKTKNNYLDFVTWLKAWAPQKRIDEIFKSHFTDEKTFKHNENLISFLENQENISSLYGWKVEFDDTNLIIKLTVKVNQNIFENEKIIDKQPRDEVIILKFNSLSDNEKYPNDKIVIELKDDSMSYQEFVNKYQENIYSNNTLITTLQKISKEKDSAFVFNNKPFDKNINEEFYFAGSSIIFVEENKTIAITISTSWEDVNNNHKPVYDYYSFVLKFKS